jgi:hypothetical protein
MVDNITGSWQWNKPLHITKRQAPASSPSSSHDHTQALESALDDYLSALCTYEGTLGVRQYQDDDLYGTRVGNVGIGALALLQAIVHGQAAGLYLGNYKGTAAATHTALVALVRISTGASASAGAESLLHRLLCHTATSATVQSQQLQMQWACWLSAGSREPLHYDSKVFTSTSAWHEYSYIASSEPTLTLTLTLTRFPPTSRI